MSLYTLRSGATQHPENSVLQLITDSIAIGGVFSVVNGDLLITAQGSPNMTVNVAAGRGYVKKSGSNTYPIINSDNTQNVTITANASGNPRIDTIVAYANLSASPNVDGTGVITLAAVAGTPSGSPSAPDDPSVASAIGTSNPFIRLANIAVAAGATSIVTANITDVRAEVIYSLLTRVVPILGVAWASSVTIDLNQPYNHYQLILGGNTTLAFTNPRPGRKILIETIQDGTGGRTITWPAMTQVQQTSDVNVGANTIAMTEAPRTGTPIVITTSGTMPGGVTASTTYYVINVSPTSIKLATSLANAQAGTALTMTSTGTGPFNLAVQVCWQNTGTLPTLTAGKYRKDLFGFSFPTARQLDGLVVAQDM
jgi:hypothetical protein